MAKIKIDKGVTLIAAHTEVSGDVRFTDQLFVNGVINGNVYASPDAKATVIISEGGTVNGQIHVPHVVINGHIEGDVFASTKVELATKARVKGNVYYKLIEMQLGAMVDGQLVHDEKVGTENVHPFPAEAGGEVSEPE